MLNKFEMLVLVALGAVGCKDEPIGPDPVGGSGSEGGSTANSGGSPEGGSSGEGGDGGSEDPGGSYESGSRLKARTLVGSDGSRSPSGWFDTETNAECTWRLAADGQQRCLPVAPFAVYYGDAGCNQPLGTADGCGVPSKMLSISSACDGAVKVYEVGGVVGVGPTLYIRTGATCTAVPAPPSVYYTLTEEPLTEYVAATVETGP